MKLQQLFSIFRLNMKKKIKKKKLKKKKYEKNIYFSLQTYLYFYISHLKLADRVDQMLLGEFIGHLLQSIRGAWQQHKHTKAFSLETAKVLV